MSIMWMVISPVTTVQFVNESVQMEMSFVACKQSVGLGFSIQDIMSKSINGSVYLNCLAVN